MAEEDLIGIWAYIAQDSLDAADRQLHELSGRAISAGDTRYQRSVCAQIRAGIFEACYTCVMSETISNVVLDRLLVPLTECLTPEVARRIVDIRADAETQKRLDELAAKANGGRLSESEREEYRAYVEAIDLVTVFQAKARSFLDNSTAR